MADWFGGMGTKTVSTLDPVQRLYMAKTMAELYPQIGLQAASLSKMMGGADDSYKHLTPGQYEQRVAAPRFADTLTQARDIRDTGVHSKAQGSLADRFLERNVNNMRSMNTMQADVERALRWQGSESAQQRQLQAGQLMSQLIMAPYGMKGAVENNVVKNQGVLDQIGQVNQTISGVSNMFGSASDSLSSIGKSFGNSGIGQSLGGFLGGGVQI